MTLPALQKTWQGGSSPGGTEFVGQVLDGGSDASEAVALFAMKESMIGFNAAAWTVAGSSDFSTAGMDATDRWLNVGNLQYRNNALDPFSWIVLRQAGIHAGNVEVLIALDDTLAADANRSNITIVVSPSAGFTGGSTTAVPTATDSFSVDGTDWLDASGAAMVSCVMSTDGACTRLISELADGTIHAIMGFEAPRLPNADWNNPVVAYVVANDAGAFTQNLWQDAEPFTAVIEDRDSNDLFASLRITGPSVNNTEVVNYDEVNGCRFYGGTLVYDNIVADYGWGSLFDWYWNSAQGAEGASVKDSFPAAGDRRFVCLGDMAIGWLDDSATDLGIAEVEFVAISSVALGSGGGGTVVVPKPAGVVEGDILLMFYLGGGGTHTVSSPAGWSLDQNTSGFMDGTQSRRAVFSKVAGAAEPASYNFTRSTGSVDSIACMVAYRPGSATQLDSAGGNSIETGATHTGPGLTTSFNQAKKVNAWMANRTGGFGSIAVTVPPAVMTSRGGVDGSSISRSDLLISVYDETIPDAGATTARSLTYDNPADGSVSQISVRAFGA